MNLENPNDLYELSGDEITVYNKLISYPPGSILFIYEFHYLKNASKTFKAIYDSKHNIKIFASGSSSLEIHKHLKESLVGRLIKNYIYPLSYNELSQLKNMDEDYFYIYGGMPEA